MPTVYIHPYYDADFLEKYGNDKELAVASLYTYLNYAKSKFESELGANIIIEEPVEFVLSDSARQNLNMANVKNETGKNDDDIYEADFYAMTRSIANGNEEYFYTHKFILYTEYPFLNTNGVRYTPGTINSNDCSYIYHRELDQEYKNSTLHELSHSIGIDDHYHNNTGENGTCDVGDSCSECGTYMYKRTEFCVINCDVYDEDEPFCNECIIELKACLYFKCFGTSQE